jgi:hypothetical protein
VSNQSIDIMKYFVLEFDTFSTNQDLELYPSNLQPFIDTQIQWINDNITEGIYKCGDAQNQHDYNTAISALFHHLDEAEHTLSRQRYMCGPQFTLADIILFTPLIRFDEIYYVHFKCNKKHIYEYPHLFDFLKELYHIEAIRNTVNMEHIKVSYYSNSADLNHFAIIPVGVNIEERLLEHHHRENFEGHKIHTPPHRVIEPEKVEEPPVVVNFEQSAEHPVEEPAEHSVEEPTEHPADEPTEHPADKPTEHPVEEPTEHPAEEPTEHPADETPSEAT